MLRIFVLTCVAAWNATNRTKFGVCYTRNMVLDGNTSEARRKLRNVVLSAASVKAVVPVCLFTDLAEDKVHEIAKSYVGRRLFDIVLSDGLASFEPRTVHERRLLEPGKNDDWRDRRLKVRSRVGRISNLGRGPFELTLFVDDDTFFCDDVAAALRDLHRGDYDVRGMPFVKRPREEAAVMNAQLCVWKHAAKQPFSVGLHVKCLDRSMSGGSFCSGAQGGAFAIRAGDRARAFADQWRDAYLDYYVAVMLSGEVKNRSSYESRSFGGDQGPLARLMESNCMRRQHRRLSFERMPSRLDDIDPSSFVDDHNASLTWSFGSLPSSINVRDANRSKRCGSPIFGPLLLLHHKRYVSHGSIDDASHRLVDLCARVNRPHDDGGGVWLGIRPPADSLADDAKCQWMRPAPTRGRDLDSRTPPRKIAGGDTAGRRQRRRSHRGSSWGSLVLGRRLFGSWF